MATAAERDVSVSSCVSIRDYDSLQAVHYFDPPYVGTDSGIYKHKWTIEDLRDLLRMISKACGFCALSGYPHELIDGCDFWTERFTWKVNVTAEVMAEQAENFKTRKYEYETAQEVLWIKEAA